ncbi:3-isopropylmalate dehydratase large subunit [Pseudoxanthomonas sp. JBR18]|uniref:3-isopropylmalate dehydratase large subunit n=1 Tax=Pseudoxanthomonas sp. JBR18 TaxID=2969308 RepID=UPI002305CC73|nr:3-isopropylmalate dehydratase large subunit [Pseudoxanthomonas sp. JBR18]WCE02748.1 3-isopropylmalate dehydratase large subunit [Pseudoxanthomonas sp. JBR18]
MDTSLPSALPRTLYRKLVDSHTARVLDADNVLLYVDLHLMNEYTSPQAFAGLDAAGRCVAEPDAQMAVVDHIIPTHPRRYRTIEDPASALQASNLKRNCERRGIALYDTNDPLQGIEHIIAPELGMIRPGMVVLCGDSHTTTYGALGALGFGIGTSEIEHVLATQTLIYRLARDMRIRVDGTLPRGVTAKDLVMHLVARLSARGARGHVVELCGQAVATLSVEARMTLCNMLVEAGARGALVAPDATTRDYVLARAPDLAEDAGMRAAALEDWAQLHSDAGAHFDAELVVEARAVEPTVSWGTSPDQALGVLDQVPTPASFEDPDERAAAQRALDYMGLQPGTPLAGIVVQRVFIGSCTNSRIEDLRAAAEVVRGQRVAKGVRAMVVPGSGEVKRQAEAEGVADALIAAGFEWRQPGCSMCLAMNDDVLSPGERCASTTNRNFEGRQGRAGRTHLMSPAMAAAAAIAGHIVDVRSFNEGRHEHT